MDRPSNRKLSDKNPLGRKPVAGQPLGQKSSGGKSPGGRPLDRKRNLAVFIDGENVPAKYAPRIMEISANEGCTDFVKVYGLQKDRSTLQWSKVAAGTRDMKDIRLYGPPARNKVDRKMQKDMLRDVRASKNIDVVVVVSSDHGFADRIRSLRTMGKRVVVVGERKSPAKLRNAASKFVQI